MGKHDPRFGTDIDAAIHKREPHLSCESAGQICNLVIPGWTEQKSIQCDLRLLHDKTPINFFIEYAYQTDPGRSVAKYWPWLDSRAVFDGSVKPIVIFCFFAEKPKNRTIGSSHFYTARFLAWKMMAAHPNLTCHVVDMAKIPSSMRNAAKLVVSEWRRLWSP